MANEQRRPEPDQIDAMLSDWKDSLQCSDEQLHRMLGVVLPGLDRCDSASLDSRPAIRRHLPSVLAFAFAATILVAISLLPVILDSGSKPYIPALDEFTRIAFTSQELHQSRVLACEVELLFEKPVLIRKCDSGCDVDDDPYFADATSILAESQRVLLRCVLQELSPLQTWEEVSREEVIGGPEQQLELSRLAHFSAQYWSHLLPNNSLWTELLVHSAPDELLVDSELQLLLQQNEPMVVWKSQGAQPSRRLLMVFELLPSCNAGKVM